MARVGLPLAEEPEDAGINYTLDQSSPVPANSEGRKPAHPLGEGIYLITNIENNIIVYQTHGIGPPSFSCAGLPATAEVSMSAS